MNLVCQRPERPEALFYRATRIHIVCYLYEINENGERHKPQTRNWSKHTPLYLNFNFQTVLHRCCANVGRPEIGYSKITDVAIRFSTTFLLFSMVFARVRVQLFTAARFAWRISFYLPPNKETFHLSWSCIF